MLVRNEPAACHAERSVMPVEFQKPTLDAYEGFQGGRVDDVTLPVMDHAIALFLMAYLVFFFAV